MTTEHTATDAHINHPAVDETLRARHRHADLDGSAGADAGGEPPHLRTYYIRNHKDGWLDHVPVWGDLSAYYEYAERAWKERQARAVISYLRSYNGWRATANGNGGEHVADMLEAAIDGMSTGAYRRWLESALADRESEIAYRAAAMRHYTESESEAEPVGPMYDPSAAGDAAAH